MPDLVARRDHPWILVSVIALLAAGFSSGSFAEGEEQPSAPSPKAVEAMRLLEAPDPYQRQLGFLRLEALRESSTVQTLRTYFTSKNPEMRACSLRAAAAIEGAGAIPVLVHALNTDKKPRVRRAALLGLEPLRQNDPELIPLFIKVLRDPDTEVRMTAVDVVSRIDDPRTREAILMREKREKRRDVRRVLALAMKRIQHE